VGHEFPLLWRATVISFPLSQRCIRDFIHLQSRLSRKRYLRSSCCYSEGVSVSFFRWQFLPNGCFTWSPPAPFSSSAGVNRLRRAHIVFGDIRWFLACSSWLQPCFCTTRLGITGRIPAMVRWYFWLAYRS